MECLYTQIKWEGLATNRDNRDIHRIIGATGEPRNLDQTFLSLPAILEDQTTSSLTLKRMLMN